VAGLLQNLQIKSNQIKSNQIKVIEQQGAERHLQVAKTMIETINILRIILLKN